MTRIALVTNLPTHYRRPIFKDLANRMDVDFYFTSLGRERYWSSDHVLSTGGLRVMGTTPRRALYRNLTGGDYDAIVCSLVGRASLLTVLAAGRRRKIPFVLWAGIWLHPTTIFHRASRPFVRLLYRRADAIVVYGSHVARYIESESGRRDRIFVAPQAVNNEGFLVPGRALRRSGSGLRVGYVGRLAEGKGLDVLLDAARSTVADVSFRIIGSGPAEQALRARVAAGGLRERIAFLGYVTQDRLGAELAGLDVLVVPSVTTPTFREPWGLVVNEAMNAGAAVVATTAVGAVAGELVVDGETGLVVSEGDPIELARAITRLYMDEQLRQTISDRARERVAELTFSAAASAIESAVAEAIERRS